VLQIIYTSRFKKDFKKIQNQTKEIIIFREILDKLRKNIKLEEKYKDHKLTGNYKNYRECHLLPDLLLIYKINDDEIILERIGSHSELF
jgi:mRNA interferase YafQ